MEVQTETPNAKSETTDKHNRINSTQLFCSSTFREKQQKDGFREQETTVKRPSSVSRKANKISTIPH